MFLVILDLHKSFEKLKIKVKKKLYIDTYKMYG